MSDGHWPIWLKAAVRMGLQPSEFWRLSLREWRMLMRHQDAGGAMNQVRLNALKHQFENSRDTDDRQNFSGFGH